jgi:hypothetical protein
MRNLARLARLFSRLYQGQHEVIPGSRVTRSFR